jgi:hypothetical protein
MIGVPENPGHQVGAALCVRQGLECASKLGFLYCLFTAEDVVPVEGSVDWILANLHDGYDYASELWGDGSQLNAQFFGCRVQALVGPFDACQVTGSGCFERYLMSLLANKRLCVPGNKRWSLYNTTHDHSTWVRVANNLLSKEGKA